MICPPKVLSMLIFLLTNCNVFEHETKVVCDNIGILAEVYLCLKHSLILTGLNSDRDKCKELRKQATKALAKSYKDYVNNHIGDSLKTNPK